LFIAGDGGDHCDKFPLDDLPEDVLNLLLAVRVDNDKLTVEHSEQGGFHQVIQGLDKESLQDLEQALKRAREAAAGADSSKLQSARDELERATLPLAALLMDSVAKRALAGKTLDQV